MLSYTEFGGDDSDQYNPRKQSDGAPQFHAPQRIGNPEVDVGLVDVVGVVIEFSDTVPRRTFCLISVTRPLKCLVYTQRGQQWRYGLTDESADEILYPVGTTVYDDIVELGMVNFWVQPTEFDDLEVPIPSYDD